MNSTYDVAVVGAGIVGAACALEFSKEGLRVAVFDKGPIGSGATGASMGHIVVMDDSEAQFALTRYSQILWEELQPELPPDVEYERCGTIWVATDADELAEVHRKYKYYQDRAVDVEILDSQLVHHAEPHLRTPLSGGLLVHGDCVLYPPRAAAFLLELACRNGAELYLGKPVTALGQGKARLSDGSIFQAKYLINAGGQHAPKLSPGIAIKPRKGHLVITDRYPGYVRHQLVELGYLKSAHKLTADSVAFNIQPRKTGQLLIGSSRQYGSEESRTEPHMISQMLARAAEYIPGIASLSATRVWTGFRPATPDKLPLIGPWPEDSSVYIAAGHEGLGITTSLATGKIVAGQVLGRRSAIPVEPYLPSRKTTEHSHV
jgi:glycine/D-amino acid oxidase-like deaminating enzyme